MNKQCSFCNKRKKIENLIEAENGIFICNECINKYSEFVEISHSMTPKNSKNRLLKPIQIKKKLDEYVIGQDEAKKILSVAVYNHYNRINYEKNRSINDIELQKSNVLLVGPTGSGKTLLAKTLAKILEVPFAIADATTLTEAGYVGDDVENILVRLFENANYDINKAEEGIIYIDEIDKISRKSENVSITRDVSGEGVQQALLKIIEGTEAMIPPKGGRKHPNQDLVKINTKNILFIVGGAFEGMDKLISSRVKNKSLGFKLQEKTEETKILKEINSKDLVKHGMIPELIGRLPIISILNPITEEALVDILIKPKDSIVKQYKKIFEFENIEIKFENSSLKTIAKKAIEKNIGARGLRSILENLMLDLMYNIPSDKSVKKIVISKEAIENKDLIEIIRK